MKKIDVDMTTIINFILTPVLYMSILMPIAMHFKSLNLIPIAMLIHTILFCCLIVNLEKKK